MHKRSLSLGAVLATAPTTPIRYYFENVFCQKGAPVPTELSGGHVTLISEHSDVSCGTHHLQCEYTIFSGLVTFFLFRRACRRPRFSRVTHASKRPKYNDHIVIALRFVESSGRQRRLHREPATTRNYSATTYDWRETVPKVTPPDTRRTVFVELVVSLPSNRARRFYWFRGNRTGRREIEREIKLS